MTYDTDVFSSGGASPDKDVFSSPKAKEPPKKEPPAPVQDFTGNLRFATPFGTIDTGLGLPEAVNRRLAQFGSGMANWGLGARQLVASDKPQNLSQIVTGQTESAQLKQEAADKRRMDAQLNDGFGGKALHFLGEAAPALALPTGYLGMLGRLAPVAEGAIGGGAMGAAQPTVEGESRGLNTALGAVGGAAVPAVIAGAKALARPADAATVALAEKYGIPVGVSDASNSKFLKGARSVLNDTPIVGMGGKAQDAAKQEALNAAVGGTFGAAEKKLTPEVLDAAKGKIGAELDRVWNNNTLQVDPQLLGTVQSLRAEAAKLPQGEGARLTGWIDDILSKVQTDANGNAIIPGDVANKLQSKLGRDVASAQGFLKDSLGTLRRDMIDTFNRSVTGADADALTLARSQYKNLKTVQPLLDKGMVGTAGREAGDVPASLLPEAVRKSFPNLSTQTNQPPLAELAQVGSRYVADRVAQTGGAPRALIQNGLLGGMLTGGGMTAGLGPTAAAVGVGAPTAALLNQALGSPTIRKILTEPAVQRGLLANPELGPMVREMLKKGLLNAPSLAGPAFVSVPASALE